MSASFWLDNSDDSIFFAPSGNVSTRSSTDSFSIDNISCLDNYPSLLLPSHSLDSLPRGDLELIKVPPCPSTTPPRRKRTHHTFLSLVASLALPKGNRPNRRYANVLISSPTPERLKNVPQLKPVLKTWISAVPNSNPPDIAPWSPPREKPHHVWVPEGSCFPPSYLKRRLRERHGPVDSYLPSAPGDSRLTVALKSIERSESSSRSRPLRRCASHSTHHARLPDCTPAYIPVTFSPVRMRGKLRRWSLGVPPSYISTELITRRLESQRIDAIIGTESALCDVSNDSPSLPLPAIKVSTSTTTIAISFPGSPEGSTTPVPEPLAIRRGKKMLAPLTLRSPQRSAEDYPGIPTAFLGTPSAYSAHFQLTSSMARRDAESLPICDMISALRSQAASLKVSSPVQLPLDIPPSSMNSLSAASSDIIPSVSEDDWAFAHDLMSRYEGPAQDRIPSKEKHHQKQAAPIRKSVTPRIGPNPAIQRSQMRRASVPAVAPSQHNRSKSSSAPRAGLDKPRHSTGVTRQRKDSRQTTPKVGTMRYRPHPESSPSLPPRSLSPVTPNYTGPLFAGSPNYSKSEPSTKRPPGILKHAKSVRFADMPKPNDANDAKGNVPPVNQPRTSTPKGAGGSPSQPSPLRASFVPEELEVETPSEQPLTGPATEVSTRVFTEDRRDFVQQTPSQIVNLRSSMFNSSTRSASPGLSDNSPSSGNSRTAKSLSLLVRERDIDKEKENNSPLALHTQKRSRRHTEVDENSARRASRVEGGGRKHRLSSPLKSFLERLRA